MKPDKTVYIKKTSPKTLRGDLNKLLLESGLLKFYNPKKRTLIKINANFDKVYPGCNTSTWFLDALISNLKSIGFSKLAVVEGDLKLQPAIVTIKKIGIFEILKKHNVSFIPLDSLPRNNNELPEILQNSQLINTPLIHTHTFAVISCATKNLFGLLPVYRERYHNELSQKLIELYHLVPCYTIVEGIIGLEGGSMRMGNPKRLDLLLAGWDPLLIDVTVAKIMGFSISEIPLLNLAMKKGLINEKIIIKGEYSYSKLPNFNFIYKKSRVAKLDLRIRKNPLTANLFKYNSIPDKLAHHVRRLLLSINYWYKKRKLFRGTWIEYYQ